MFLVDPPVAPGQTDFSQILVNIGADPVIAVIISEGVFVVIIGYVLWLSRDVLGKFFGGGR